MDCLCLLFKKQKERKERKNALYFVSSSTWQHQLPVQLPGTTSHMFPSQREHSEREAASPVPSRTKSAFSVGRCGRSLNSHRLPDMLNSHCAELAQGPAGSTSPAFSFYACALYLLTYATGIYESGAGACSTLICLLCKLIFIHYLTFFLRSMTW